MPEIGMQTTRITVAELFDAIEKNGLPKIKGSYLTDELLPGTEFYTVRDEGSDIKNPVGGCAMGQAAFNLGVNPSVLNNASSYISLNGEYDTSLPSWVVEHNDNTDMSLKEIADAGRKLFRDVLDREIVVPLS